MNAASILNAIQIPTEARVDQRIAKKLLIENGTPTTADKRAINEGIEEILWLAALKPSNIGIPVYRDDVREYLEIAVISLTLRPKANASRLTRLIHRSIPYPIFLVQTHTDKTVLSLGHLRWSQGQSGKTVLDGSIMLANLELTMPTTAHFVAALNISSQPRQHLFAFYQGWIECFEAYAASQITQRFKLAADATAADRRRMALVEHERLMQEIAQLRAQAAKTTQINRRVELNGQINKHQKRIEELIFEF